MRELTRGEPCPVIYQNHYIWGLIRGRKRTEMTATEALRVQLDNLQWELQLLQVENKRLQVDSEEQRGDKQSVKVLEEAEDLRQ